jgi:hypothetical protein
MTSSTGENNRAGPARTHRIHRIVGALSLASSAVVASIAHGAAVGDPIDEAVAVHVSTAGFDQLGEAVARVMPEVITIEASSGALECAESDPTPLDWSLDPVDVYLSIDEVGIDTTAGDIVISVYATLASSASALTVLGDCTVLTDLDETCGLELPTTAMNITMNVDITETDGVFDVTVTDPAFDISPVVNPLSDCTFASAVGTILGQDPELLSTLIASLVAPELDALGPSLEAPLEDALNGLQIDSSVDLLGTPLDISLYPSALTLDEQGLVLGLGAELVPGSVSDCVDSSAGSDLAEVGWPTLDGTAPDSTLPYDAGIFLGVDFIDHALYTVWASGALCLDAGALAADFIPGGLNTDFLGALLGEDFEALFPEAQPITLLLSVPTPMRGAFDDDGAPVHVLVDDLTLDLYSEFEHRQTRIFQVQGKADIGLDVTIDENTLTTALVLDDPAVDFTESYHELIGPGFSDGLAALIGTLLTSLIPDDLLPSLALPDLLGVQIDALIWLPNSDQTWQGGFVSIDTSGVEPVELTGCSLDGVGCDGGDLGVELDLETLLGCSGDTSLGCDDSTCATGGSRGLVTRAVRGRVALGAFVMAMLVGLRRRKS